MVHWGQGRVFFETSVPGIVKQLSRLNDNLETNLAYAKERDALEDARQAKSEADSASQA